MVGYPNSASAERGPGLVLLGLFSVPPTLTKVPPPGKLQACFFHVCVQVCGGEPRLELHLGLFYWALFSACTSDSIRAQQAVAADCRQASVASEALAEIFLALLWATRQWRRRLRS